MLGPIGVLAVINYYRAGHVNIKFALILMLTFVIGSWFGSKWAVNLPERTLKQIFGILMMIVAAKMIFGKQLMNDLKNEIKEAILEGDIKNNYNDAYTHLLKIAAERGLTVPKREK